MKKMTRIEWLFYWCIYFLKFNLTILTKWVTICSIFMLPKHPLIWSNNFLWRKWLLRVHCFGVSSTDNLGPLFNGVSMETSIYTSPSHLQLGLRYRLLTIPCQQNLVNHLSTLGTELDLSACVISDASLPNESRFKRMKMACFQRLYCFLDNWWQVCQF